jgi:hypothetical protein
MKTIHLNEQMQICADQQNPFVQNKPYNPDQVMGYVIKHLLRNVYPVSVQEEQNAQHLYITAVQYLLSRDLAVTEANIVKNRAGIRGELPQVQQEIQGTKSQLAGDAPANLYDGPKSDLSVVQDRLLGSETDTTIVSNSSTGTTPTSTSMQAASASKKEETMRTTRLSLGSATCGGIVLKKEWVKWGVIAILILVVIKILK